MRVLRRVRVTNVLCKTSFVRHPCEATLPVSYAVDIFSLRCCFRRADVQIFAPLSVRSFLFLFYLPKKKAPCLHPCYALSDK